MLDDQDNDGGWEHIPTKQAKIAAMQERRHKKAMETQKRREEEQREHDLKQKKINELFADNASAFSTSGVPAATKVKSSYNNPWGVLDDDGDGSDQINKSKKSEKNQPEGKRVEEGGFLYTSKFINQQEKKKQQAIQKQKAGLPNKQKSKSSTKKEDLAIESAKESFHYNKYYETIKTVEAKYPNTNDIQLKYVVECLEEYFGQVQVSSSDISDLLLLKDYPLSHFDQKFVTETVSFLERKKADSIVPTIVFLINTLVSIVKQDKDALKSSGLGLMLFLQIVFKHIKEVPLLMLDYFKTTFNPNTFQSLKPSVASIHLWLAIQPLPSSNKVPLSVYYTVIFPVKLTPHVKVPAALNELFKQFENKLSESIGSNTKAELNEQLIKSSLEQFIWAAQKGQDLSAMSSEYTDLLLNSKALFPSKKVPQSYLTVLLSNTAIANEVYRDKILETIVNCLKIDADCFEYIKKAYNKNVAQTNNLLLYLSFALEKGKLGKKAISHGRINELAQFCKDSNDAILKDQSSTNNKNKKKPLSKNVDLNDIEMCSVTCETVLKSFKPTPAAKTASSFLGPLLVVPIVIATGLFARKMLCNFDHNDELLQKLSQTLCN